ncbi:6801_t:CDS:1, partial [Gigaspora rosea]
PSKDDLDKMYTDFSAATQEIFNKIKEQFENFKEDFNRSTEIVVNNDNKNEDETDDISNISIKDLMKIPDTNDSFPNEKDSDKPSNEDINEKDKEADEINNQADEIIEQVFKIITKATPSIIKAILEDGNL